MAFHSWASVPVIGRARKVGGGVEPGKAMVDVGQAIVVAQMQGSPPTVRKVTCRRF